MWESKLNSFVRRKYQLFRFYTLLVIFNLHWWEFWALTEEKFWFFQFSYLQGYFWYWLELYQSVKNYNSSRNFKFKVNYEKNIILFFLQHAIVLWYFERRFFTQQMMLYAPVVQTIENRIKSFTSIHCNVSQLNLMHHFFLFIAKLLALQLQLYHHRSIQIDYPKVLIF